MFYSSFFAFIVCQAIYTISAMYITSPNHSALFDAAQSAINHSTPTNFNTADTTPINAPPAIKPEAINVPRSKRALFNASSFEREDTNQATRPPITNGAFKYIGINIPNENANAGTPIAVKTNAKAAPIKYRIHGVEPPVIKG